MEASLESGAKAGKAGKKKAARAPKVKRKLRLRDARVGTMLLWVMAFFALLIVIVLTCLSVSLFVAFTAIRWIATWLFGG